MYSITEEEKDKSFKKVAVKRTLNCDVITGNAALASMLESFLFAQLQ